MPYRTPMAAWVRSSSWGTTGASVLKPIGTSPFSWKPQAVPSMRPSVSKRGGRGTMISRGPRIAATPYCSARGAVL